MRTEKILELYDKSKGEIPLRFHELHDTIKEYDKSYAESILLPLLKIGLVNKTNMKSRIWEVRTREQSLQIVQNYLQSRPDFLQPLLELLDTTEYGLYRLLQIDSEKVPEAPARVKENKVNPNLWKKEENDLIEKMVKDGHGWDDIAKALPHRTKAAVCKRGYDLNLKIKSDKRWTQDENNLLCKLRAKGVDYDEIQRQMPNRSRHNLINHYCKLKR